MFELDSAVGATAVLGGSTVRVQAVQAMLVSVKSPDSRRGKFAGQLEAILEFGLLAESLGVAVLKREEEEDYWTL